MHIIYLEVDDEITAVIDKMTKDDVSDIVLVIPRRAVLTQSIVNLKLLRKESERLEKNVIVVVSDNRAYHLAERAGLVVKTSIPDEQVFVEGGVVEEVQAPAELVVREVDEDVQRVVTEPEESSGDEDADRFPSISDFSSLDEDLDEVEEGDSEHAQEEYVPAGGSEQERTSISKRRKKLARKVKKSRMTGNGIRFFALFVFVVFVVVGAVVLFVLPTATVTIVPETESYVGNVDLVIEEREGGVDITNSLIPGILLFAEADSERKTFQANGVRSINEPARGTVVVLNSFSSTPQILVANTRFQSPDGKIYRLERDVTVPGARIEGGSAVAGRLNVEIVADEPGEAYNLDSTTFIIPGLPPDKQDDIYAQSVTEIAGGKVEETRVVNEDDFNAAKDELIASLSDELFAEIEKQLPDGSTFFEDAIKSEAIETRSSVEVDSEGESFDLEVKVRFSTLAFSLDDLAQIIDSQVSTAISDETYLLNPGAKEGVSATLQSFDFDQRKMGASLSIDKRIAYSIDEDGLVDQLAGVSEQEIPAIIGGFDHIESFDVEFWPFWVKTVPKLEKKVRIRLDTES